MTNQSWWKVCITPVNGDAFTVFCSDFEYGDGCLQMGCSLENEPPKHRAYPLCNIIEITAEKCAQ